MTMLAAAARLDLDPRALYEARIVKPFGLETGRVVPRAGSFLAPPRQAEPIDLLVSLVYRRPRPVNPAKARTVPLGLKERANRTRVS